MPVFFNRGSTHSLSEYKGRGPVSVKIFGVCIKQRQQGPGAFFYSAALKI